MGDWEQLWKSVRASIEAGEPLTKSLQDEAETLVCKARGGRIVTAGSNGHSKVLAQHLRPNALARRRILHRG